MDEMLPHQDPENAGKIGLRFNSGKRPMHLMPPAWINGLADVLQFGSKKYADRNWENGMDWSIPYACAIRHLLAWWDGERCDKESGLHHLLHAAWNCLAAFYYEVTGRYGAYDDRPKYVAEIPKLNPTPTPRRTVETLSVCPACRGVGCEHCSHKGTIQW